jgi:hypothetical protein
MRSSGRKRDLRHRVAQHAGSDRARHGIGRRGDRVELRGDQLRRARGQVAADGGVARHERAHRLSDRYQRHADAGQQVRKVRGARRTAPPRRVAATAPPRTTIGSASPSDPYADNTHAFCYSHFVGSGVRPAIMRHDAGLAGSPLWSGNVREAVARRVRRYRWAYLGLVSVRAGCGSAGQAARRRCVGGRSGRAAGRWC